MVMLTISTTFELDNQAAVWEGKRVVYVCNTGKIV